MATSTAKRGLFHLNLWAVCHCVAERFGVSVLVLDCDGLCMTLDSTGGTRVDLILLRRSFDVAAGLEWLG